MRAVAIISSHADSIFRFLLRAPNHLLQLLYALLHRPAPSSITLVHCLFPWACGEAEQSGGWLSACVHAFALPHLGCTTKEMLFLFFGLGYQVCKGGELLLIHLVLLLWASSGLLNTGAYTAGGYGEVSDFCQKDRYCSVSVEQRICVNVQMCTIHVHTCLRTWEYGGQPPSYFCSPDC